MRAVSNLLECLGMGAAAVCAAQDQIGLSLTVGFLAYGAGSLLHLISDLTDDD